MPAVVLCLSFMLTWRTTKPTTRLLVTHHKTGTSLSHKLADIFRGSSDSKLYYFLSHYYDIDTVGHSTYPNRIADTYSYVLHLMRNPFSACFSAYLYHMKTGTEPWLTCPLEMQLTNIECTYLMFTWPALTTALKAVKHARSHLHGREIMLKSTLHAGKFSYPDPSGHSYQSYLKQLNPLEGVILEYIRSTDHTIKPMVADYQLVSQKQADNLNKNAFNQRVEQDIIGANISFRLNRPSPGSKWDDRVRDTQREIVPTESYRSLCLEHISHLSPNGSVSTTERGAILIARYLGIRGLTWMDMYHLHLWINLNQGTNDEIVFSFLFLIPYHVIICRAHNFELQGRLRTEKSPYSSHERIRPNIQKRAHSRTRKILRLP